MGQLILIAVATFVSEDLTCLSTGALIAAGRLGFIPGVLACIAGIYAGDLLLYLAGRTIGRPIARWRPLRHLLTDEKLESASRWLAEHGAKVVVLSRFTPGLRLPTYVAAGLLRTRFWTFSLYFLLAALLWTPVLVGAAALLGKSRAHFAFFAPALLLTDWRTRRRLLGLIRRWTRWEFWPPWLAYLPVIPYILYLGVKHRCLTLFTAANPGIESGGFIGESKSAILDHLPHVPDFRLLPTANRVEAVRGFLEEHGLRYPVVLKPDVGERGTDVAVVRSDGDVARYFDASPGPTIVQRYAPGLEFGIFYYRYPGEAKGHIFSITEKRFPAVTGDGVRSIEQLVMGDERAVCLAGLYLERLKRQPSEIPQAGEVIPLAELGSHCRGAIFLNGGGLATAALEAVVDAAAQSHPGFHFGRFDVRAGSIGDLQAGRFAILELNGVTAEATHIYDPSVGILEAYRTLFTQWRMAFEIGARNRRSGWQPMPLMEFIHLVKFRESRATHRQVTVPVPLRLR